MSSSQVDAPQPVASRHTERRPDDVVIVTVSRVPDEVRCTVSCGQRSFHVAEGDMRAFLRVAHEVAASGRHRLIPLRHLGGVALLRIGPLSLARVQASDVRTAATIEAEITYAHAMKYGFPQ